MSLLGVRHQIADLERPLLGRPHLLDDELEIVLVILDPPADLRMNPLSGMALKMSRVAFHIRAVTCAGAIGDERLDEVFARWWWRRTACR